MNIRRIFINIKFGDLIRFLIGWFDLIMGLIKDLFKFLKNFMPKLKELIKCKDLNGLLKGQINLIKYLIDKKK